jgi:hypothetical protein
MRRTRPSAALRFTLFAAVLVSIAACKPSGSSSAQKQAPAPTRIVVHAEPKPYEGRGADYVTSLQRGDFIVECILAYHQDHGAYPETLSDLVPTYVTSIPRPVAGNDKWDYLRSADGSLFTLCFGENKDMYPCAWWDSAKGAWSFDQ